MALTDIEIARANNGQPIREISEKLGLDWQQLVPFGHDKAKLSLECVEQAKNATPGRLILVTAMTPTPAGEGKTTTSVGLSDGLTRIGKKAVVCLREPSLGPCFGI